jgi:hypothetical protein
MTRSFIIYTLRQMGLVDQIKDDYVDRHVKRMGEVRSAYVVLVGRFERKNHLRDLDIDRRIILKLILKNRPMVWTGLI